MGGMISGTVFAVFLVPVFFVVVRKLFPEKLSAFDHHAPIGVNAQTVVHPKHDDTQGGAA